MFKLFENVFYYQRNKTINKNTNILYQKKEKPDLKFIKQSAIEPDIKLLYANINGINKSTKKAVDETNKLKNECKYKDFVFKNMGNVVINQLYISVENSNLKYLIKYSMVDSVINVDRYSCCEILNKRVFPNDMFKIRLYYNPTNIDINNELNSLLLTYKDDNNHFWNQHFLFNCCDLSETTVKTKEEFMKNFN